MAEKKIYNTFEFIGKVNIPNKLEYFYKINKKENGWEGHSVRFTINESPTNGGYVEVFGMTDSKKTPYPIKTFAKSKIDEDGNYISQDMLEIPFAVRNEESSLRMVGDLGKYVVDFTTDDEAKYKGYQLRNELRKLEEKLEHTSEELARIEELYDEIKTTTPDRHEFLSPYDVALFLVEELPKHKQHTYRATGNIEFSEYNGKIQQRFAIKNLEVVTKDNVDNKLSLHVDLFFSKGAVDDKYEQDEGKVFLETYALSRDNKTKKDQLFPFPVVINTSKINFEDEKHLGRLNLLKNLLTVKDRKAVNHLPHEIKYIRGTEEKEFSAADLTKEQQELIEFGINTIDDFKPKGQLYGDVVEEFRIIKPLVKVVSGVDFSSGSLESQFEVDDLGYKPLDEEIGEDVKELVESKEESKPEMKSQEDAFDDLFG